MILNEYVWMSSEQNKNIYPDNKPYKFKVQLPQNIPVGGNCLIGLCKIRGLKTQKPKEIYICCDQCQYSIVDGNLYPVLRCIDTSEEVKIIQTPFYISSKVIQSIDQLSFYILDGKGELASFLKEPLKITIHIKSGNE